MLFPPLRSKTLSTGGWGDGNGPAYQGEFAPIRDPLTAENNVRHDLVEVIPEAEVTELKCRAWRD